MTKKALRSYLVTFYPLYAATVRVSAEDDQMAMIMFHEAFHPRSMDKGSNGGDFVLFQWTENDAGYRVDDVVPTEGGGWLFALDNQPRYYRVNPYKFMDIRDLEEFSRNPLRRLRARIHRIIARWRRIPPLF